MTVSAKMNFPHLHTHSAPLSLLHNSYRYTTLDTKVLAVPAVRRRRGDPTILQHDVTRTPSVIRVLPRLFKAVVRTAWWCDHPCSQLRPRCCCVQSIPPGGAALQSSSPLSSVCSASLVFVSVVTLLSSAVLLHGLALISPFAARSLSNSPLLCSPLFSALRRLTQTPAGTRCRRSAGPPLLSMHNSTRHEGTPRRDRTYCTK